jgi:hypothetical protein
MVGHVCGGGSDDGEWNVYIVGMYIYNIYIGIYVEGRMGRRGGGLMVDRDSD